MYGPSEALELFVPSLWTAGHNLGKSYPTALLFRGAIRKSRSTVELLKSKTFRRGAWYYIKSWETKKFRNSSKFGPSLKSWFWGLFWPSVRLGNFRVMKIEAWLIVQRSELPGLEESSGYWRTHSCFSTPVGREAHGYVGKSGQRQGTCCYWPYSYWSSKYHPSRRGPSSQRKG